MPENVEIKAKLEDFDKTYRIASDICKTGGILLNQEDIFFNVSQGRLKLRNIQDSSDSKSELISYSRPDTEGPKISKYSICKIENKEDILKVLESALGVVGVVKKKRHLFLYNQTRIHLDIVENLGEYLELEVVLSKGQNLSDGVKIANELLEKLEVSKEHLVKGAYIDLL